MTSKPLTRRELSFRLASILSATGLVGKTGAISGPGLILTKR